MIRKWLLFISVLAATVVTVGGTSLPTARAQDLDADGAISSWWASPDEPFMLHTEGKLRDKPELVKVQIAPNRWISGYEAIVFLLMRDYIRFNKNGLLTTTEKYKTWKREHKDPAPRPPPQWGANDVEPGRYSYSGGDGYAYVSIQDPTVVIKLQWKPYVGEFEVKADRSAAGKYVGSFYVARHAKKDPKLLPMGPYDVFVEYLPATKDVRLTTKNGTEFIPGGILELKKEP